MPIKVVRKKSECKGCPLDGMVKIKCHGFSEEKKPEVLLIGDAPGSGEEMQGIPFSGYTGHLVKNAVDSTGHLFHKSHRTYVLPCKPPKGVEEVQARENCKAGMWEELYEVWKRGCKVIVTIGSTATEALGLSGSLSKIRGSVFPMAWQDADMFLHGFTGGKVLVENVDKHDLIVIPTYHPSFMLRGNLKHEVTFANDIDKAYGFVGKEYKRPKEDFVLFPTIQEVEAFTDECLSLTPKPLLAVDIETSGFIPGKAAILMIGIALDGQRAFSIPFLKQGGGSNWPDKKQWYRAQECVRRLMAECPTMYQNALFDARHLEHFKTPALDIRHDTMILHHVLNPELPHNLGYITSVYGSTPYWKDEVIGSFKRMIHMDDEIVRTYNLRDCVVLHQVLPEMLKEAKESGTLKVYEKISMPLVPVVLRMIENGMLIDKDRLKKWRLALKRKEKRLLKALEDSGRVPEGFNFNSGDHLKYLVFGLVPTQYERAQKDIEAYEEEGSKKKKNTKKYKELEERVKIFKGIEPFPRLRHALKKTESGSVSLDEEALLNVQVAVNNRLDELKKLRKPLPKHEEERNVLVRLRTFLKSLLDYKEVAKLISTYTSFPTDENNRIHSPYRITGTTTGRFSSGDKTSGEAGNVQNIPKGAKHIFIAPEGWSIVEIDYSNLEMVIIAELSDDDTLRQVFKKGLNVHDVNCKDMFGLTVEDAQWEDARRACKTYIFGRNYGGGLKGIYQRVMKAVPELGLTYGKFCEADGAYRKSHPAYVKWADELEKGVQAERCLENAFGRRRYFLGSMQEIVREGLNFPVQSTAADLININLIEVQEGIDKGEIRGKIIGSVHDSILLEMPNRGLKENVKKVKMIMEKKRKIGKNRVSFLTEVTSGPSWGEGKVIEI